MQQYPSAPFAQVEALLSDLIDSYQQADTASSIMATSAAVRDSIREADGAETRLKGLISDCADKQQRVARLAEDVSSSQGQLQQQQITDEPRIRHMLSLYAHVSRMVFDNATLGTPVLKATISNSATGDITAVSVDVRKEPAATTADRIWELIAG